MDKKILVLDGISGISLGKEIEDAFRSLGENSQYIAAADLQHKAFYKPVSAIKKALHKQFLKQDFYKNPKITNTSLIKTITQAKPDIIFVIGFLYRFFDLELIKKLKKAMGFNLYLYDTDSCNLFSNKRELLYFFNNELPVYDHIYSFSKTTSQFINKLNHLNASHLAFGATPIPLKEENKEQDVLFVGSADMRRIYLLEHLTSFKLAVFGSKWRRNKDIISSELNDIISTKPIWKNELHQQLFKSKIILNITRSSFYGVETGINLRIFETLAAKGFLLTDYTPELGELFQIGTEIESYSSSKELVDKVKYYLKNEDKRNKIAQKGHDLYLAKYTWNSRLKELLSHLNMIKH